VILREDDLEDIIKVLQTISMERIYEMRQQLDFFYNKYFRSIKDITLTTLQIINDRVFPYAGRKFEEWNDFPRQVSTLLLSIYNVMVYFTFCCFLKWTADSHD